MGGVRLDARRRSPRRRPSCRRSSARARHLRHAVWLDDEIVCTGTASPTEHGLLLYGGATAERARGRGAYRALIRARWDDAVALGTPALITQGGSMSRPILERLGFERVGEVHMLLDVFADA